MTIEDRIRNTEIPLYYWIREKGSINNVKSGMMLGYRPIGWHIATEVLERYYKLKGIKPNKMNKFDKIVCDAAYRYGSKPQFVEANFNFHVVGDREL
jgi:hypothetical protein